MNSAGHLTPEEAAAFEREGSGLAAAERLAMSDHAAGCAVCQARLAGAQAARSDLGRVFAGLVEAGRQQEDPAAEPWTGAEEFMSALPALTPAERAGARSLETRMSQFEVESFVPGDTLEAERGTVRRGSAGNRARAEGGWNWWQRLVSWQGLTLTTGALAALVWAVPPGMHTQVFGPGAMRSGPSAELMDGPLQVSADGTLAGLAAIPADLRDAVVETIRRGAAPGSMLGKLTRGGGPGSGPAAAAAVNDPALAGPISPVGTSVEVDQPVFRWKAGTPPGAVEIVVRPSAGSEEIRSVPLPTGTVEWTPPTPLARGALYRWQIVPVLPDGQTVGAAATGGKAGAVFKVLSADTQARLEGLRAGASGQSHLTLGVAYAREGLREESAREFRALRESNAQSGLAKRLVDSVEGRGG